MSEIRILCASDNHGNAQALLDLKQKYSDFDYFLHCGDSQVPAFLLDGWCAVQGNTDMPGCHPYQMVIPVGSHRIYLTHGNHELYGGFENLAVTGKANGCDIVCFGHTHIYADTEVDGIRLLNPGSLRSNRDGTGPSYMIIRISGDDVKAERCSYQRSPLAKNRTIW
ncbi:MAG: YfcE family phosphodiesterase [Bulleidia sp.]|nr:YfcE family phosphodiesterase [Bulleidia sp.]